MEGHTFMFSAILFLIIQQYKICLCVEPRDEYTADRKYYKVKQNLATIPIDMPIDVVWIVIESNLITKIQANLFHQLSQCTILSLRDNQIDAVEAGAFNGLVNLINLDLSNNQLKQLDANMFTDLKNCTYLHLDDNLIQEIEPGSFNGLSNLEQLDLCNNKLIILKADMFQGLVALESLNLCHNGIFLIDDNTFAHMKKLQSLSLHHNDLTTLSPGTFSGLESLETLNLEGNHLTSLPGDLFNDQPRPLRLNLYNNYINHNNILQCDSQLCWLKQEELNGTIIWPGDSYIYGPRCANLIPWDLWRCDLEMGDRKLNNILITLGLTASVITVFLICLCSIKMVRKAAFKCICRRNKTSSQERSHTDGPSVTESQQHIGSHNQHTSISNGKVSVVTEEQHEYMGLQKQPDRYQQLKFPIMENESVSGYMAPQNEYHEVPDYPTYLQPEN